MQTDDIDLFYTLKEHGWSTCYLFINGKMHEMIISHVFNDPIGEMLDSLIVILSGAKESNFSWFDEPGEYHWNLKRYQDRQHIIIINITSDDKQLDGLSFEIKIKHFCILLLSQMMKIQELLRENYSNKNRKGKFPYQIFKQFCNAYYQKYGKYGGIQL